VGVGGLAFSRRVTAGLVLLALTVSVASLVDLAWIVPAANQEFRMAVTGRADLVKGVPELTLGELSREIEIVQRNHQSGLAYSYSTTPENHVRELAFNYHLRLALACSPLVFVLFALSIAAGSTLRRWMLAVAACGAVFSYHQLLYAGRALVLSGRIPAYVSAWLPNAVFALIVAFLTLRNAQAIARDEPA
jgi:lipopolysaccharide export LptBFGC system permease protein LptF